MDIWPEQIEVVYFDRRWHVRYVYNDSPLDEIVDARWKRDAKNLARGIALTLGHRYKDKGKPLELVVKGRNGRIQQKDSFGTDPKGVKG